MKCTEGQSCYNVDNVIIRKYKRNRYRSEQDVLDKEYQRSYTEQMIVYFISKMEVPRQ